MSSPRISAHPPVYEDYARCVHCGICLNTCPTYRLWNVEADSPRGRIHQMIQVELQGASVSDSFVEHIDKCLDCRSCETACPSGVEYGRLVEHARARIETDYKRPILRAYRSQFHVPQIAAVSATYRLACSHVSFLSAFRSAIRRARQWDSQAPRLGRSRDAVACDRRFLFLLATWPHISRLRSTTRPRCVFRRMRCASHLHQTQRSHHPRAHCQRLRRCGPGHPILLRSAGRARRRS